MSVADFAVADDAAPAYAELHCASNFSFLKGASHPEELIERARRALNGDRFGRLWQGDTSDYGNDHSRADLALCRILSFWCRGDAERVDRLFRRSGLMRDKWDRRAGDVPYGARTIRAVIP